MIQIIETMKCPNCNESLVMSERSGVEIDYCPNCRGVWLDRGELDKIIEKSAPARPGNQQYSSGQSYDQSYHKKKKRESFLGDLFDF